MHLRGFQAPLKKSIHLTALIFMMAFLLPLTIAGHAYATPPHLANDTQKNAKPDLSQKAQIRFLTSTDFAPFNSLSAHGRLTGYNIDLIRAICQELAISARCLIEARPWSEHLAAIQNNEADALVSGLTINREKRMSLAFTRPYFSLPARFVAIKSENSQQDTFSPNGKTVGVVAGTAHEALLKAYFPKAERKTYTSDSLMKQDLRDGKIQLIFGDAMSLSLWMAPNAASLPDERDNSGACCEFVGGAYPAPDYLGQGMTIALRKQDTDLRMALNNAISALERKGVLSDLYLRYFPVDFY